MRIPNWFFALAACIALAGCAQDKWMLADGQHPQAYQAKVTQVVGEHPFILGATCQRDASGEREKPIRDAHVMQGAIIAARR